MLEGNTLVLNRSWLAVHVTSVRRALSLLFAGCARALHPDNMTVHEWDEWSAFCEDTLPGRYVQTPSRAVRIPEVIVLNFFNGFIRHEVRFSREAIFERDDNFCQYCTHDCAHWGKRLPRAQLTLDHVMPSSRGGPDTWENLVVACHSANVKKGNRTPDEAGMRLLRKPAKPPWSPPLSSRLNGDCQDLWRRFIDPGEWSLQEAAE